MSDNSKLTESGDSQKGIRVTVEDLSGEQERGSAVIEGSAGMTENDSRNVIGEFTPFAYQITCEREPEVGIAWMACIHELGLCALGGTPKEAGESLFKSLKVSGHGKLYEENCASLEKTGSTWRPL